MQHYGLPPSVFDGNKAVTVQSFTELNVKAGAQFEAAGYEESATISDLILITGNKPVIIKLFDVQINGDGLLIQYFEGPTYTSIGAEVSSYNLRKGSDVDATMQVFDIDDANVSDDGAATSPLIPVIGSTSPGTSATPTGSGQELERVLDPNTEYLIKRSGLDAGQAAQKSAYYMTWYEGDISTDVQLDSNRGVD